MIDEAKKAEETASLESDESLAEIAEQEEDETLPPEEVPARFNPTKVFVLIIMAIVLVAILLMFFSTGNSKKKGKELDKSGVRTEVRFDQRKKEDDQSSSAPNPEAAAQQSQTDDEEILAGLPDNLKFSQPEDYQQQKPQVTRVGSYSGAAQSSRPDTKNSRSPRKIEGLKGQEYTANANSNIIEAMMNGSSGGNGKPKYYSTEKNAYTAGRPDKEEYIKQMTNRVYETNNSPPFEQTQRESFFSNNRGNTSSGYLGYNALWDGTIISGALMTAINTDNPGVVIARVTENVYSSFDNSLLLIPEGSLLYATYNSSVSYGQSMVQVAWNLLIRPDGYRVMLGNMNGTSIDGQSGYKGRVNNHPWETLKAMGMIAIYSLIQTEFSRDINKTNNEYLRNASQDVYAQTQKIGGKIIDRALDIKPTIKIPQGTEIKLITNVPLELPPVEIKQPTMKYKRK